MLGENNLYAWISLIHIIIAIPFSLGRRELNKNKDMKKLLFILTLLLIACSKDTSETKSGATNEYEISTRVSFKENSYTMYVNYIHDEDLSFTRYEQNNQTDSFFEDSRSFLADNKIGIEIESKTTVPTEAIDIKIRNVGSGELLVSKTIDQRVAYNIPGQHKVRLIYDVVSDKVDVEFMN